MRLLVQRVSSSDVTVDKKIVGKINNGLTVFVGFTTNDTEEDIIKMSKKLINLRIFNDDNDIMNKSLLETKGEILLVSQFTLYADTKKGNRPFYGNALNPEAAKKLYEYMINHLKQFVKVEAGIFGADMKVNIINDGPVTIFLDSNT